MSEQGRTLIFALNPSVDVEWEVPDVVWEEKNNILSERRWAGGKGVNVARWFRLLGGDGLLVLPLGGMNGREMESFLKEEGLAYHAVPIAQSTRANIIVTTRERRQIRLNPLGPELTRQEWDQLFDFLKDKPADTVVFSGALPRNAPVDTYRKLLELCRQLGPVKTILDCDKKAFEEGVLGKPFLVKPNTTELEQWVGRKLSGQSQVLEAACELCLTAETNVLVSMGADGALLAWRDTEGKSPRIFRAYSYEVPVLNTVGAGDSLLAAAALTLPNSMEPIESLKLSIAASTLAVSRPAGILPRKEEIYELSHKIQVSEI
jgi:1-phosphofructokinase family hexose kinase